MIKIHKLVRSKRKTLSLIVELDGTLTVRAPLRMKEDDIRGFVDEKKNWIQRKQAKVKTEALAPRQYADGETFPFLGKQIPLRLVMDQKPALVLDKSFKLTSSALPRAKSVFTDWYREEARRFLTGRVEYFAQEYGFTVKKIRISSARTRWGSCSSKGTLSFAWRLVLAPLEVIDYVVVHELCHMREMNHSRAFWALVASILPDYKKQRTWLKQNGGKLIL